MRIIRVDFAREGLDKSALSLQTVVGMLWSNHPAKRTGRNSYYLKDH